MDVKSKLFALFIALGELRESYETGQVVHPRGVRFSHPPRDELNPFERVLGKKEPNFKYGNQS